MLLWGSPRARFTQEVKERDLSPPTPPPPSERNSWKFEDLTPPTLRRPANGDEDVDMEDVSASPREDVTAWRATPEEEEEDTVDAPLENALERPSCVQHGVSSFSKIFEFCIH